VSEIAGICTENGQLSVLELDNPNNIFLRLFIFVWFFYWLPFNFETATRRELMRIGLKNEVREVGFVNIKKYSIYHGVFQTVTGIKTAHNK
jgi:ubiquinone/menaquinone biosynthesis C-methylase UbiE